MKEFIDLYQNDVVIIIGGGLLQGGPDLTATCQRLMNQVEQV